MQTKLIEAGYTPANLRAIIKMRGWTQAQAADACGVSEVTIRRYLMTPDKKSHVSMTHGQWILFCELFAH